MNHRLFRSMLSIVLALSLIISMTVISSAEVASEAQSAILIDANTGEVLFEKDADTQRRPASMTKMMTAILTVENLDMDQKLTISKHVTTIGGSALGLKKNEKIKVRDVLGVMLVYSANDCAVALAEGVAGSEEKFAEMMTERAKELGCTNTTFKNPSGLDAKGHMSTARDMALIAKEAMKHQEIRDIVANPTYQTTKTNKREQVSVLTTDRLLYDSLSWIEVNGKSRHPYYKYAKGIKTGYTEKAGGCLASYAVKNDEELISVVMKAEAMTRFSSAIELLEYGFDNYENIELVRQGDIIGSAKVKGGKARKVEAYADRSYQALAANGTKGNAKTEIVFNEIIRAPIKKGDKLGKVNIVLGDQVVGSVNLKAANSVEQSFWGKICVHSVLKALMILAGLLVAALAALVAFKGRKRKKLSKNPKNKY